MNGSGRLPTVNITFNPGGLTFPDTQIGSNSPQDVVVIRNNSANDLNFGPGSFFITGPNANSFEINQPSPGTCVLGGGLFTLAAGANCTVRLRFTPGGQNQGPRSGALAILYSVGGGNPVARSVPLNGIATTPKGTAAIATPPANTNFPDTPLNGFSTKVVIFTNTGIGSVDVTGIFSNGGNSGEFTVDSTNCNVAPIVPNGTCQAIVRFTPVAPVGATQSSALRFTYEAVNTNVVGVPADVQLQGLVAAALQPTAEFIPTGFNFGNMIIGQMSAPKLFTFTNTGPLQVIVATAPTTFGNLDFPIAANPPGDCFVGLVLESGQSCETYVSFAPQAAGGVGPRNGYLSITLNGGNVITAQLSGVAVESGLIVSTFGENFGQVIVGSASGQRQIIITNPGTNPNTVGPLAITKGGTNPTDFEVDTNTCAPNKTLLPTESCSIFVRFKPGTPGEKEALIGITVGTVTGQYIVILSGQAVEPKLTISAPGYANGELNFGAFPIGAFSDLRPVTITNSSTNAVTLDTDFTAGAGNFTVDQTACDGKTLGTNESCTLYVRFTPQAGPGEKFGTVTVDTAGLAGSYVITLHGTAVAPVLTVNTPVDGILDFGQKVINQSPSAPQSITITNNTGATLTGLTYIPNADPAFLIDNGTCGTTLTPGQSCTINVRFQPTTAGNKSGTIVIDGDNIDGSYNFFLYGVGIEPGLLITGPNLVNGQVDFGSQPIGSLSARQEIVVTNTTTGALTVNTNGINLLPFFVINDSLCNGKTLAPGESCSIFVRFFPTNIGPRLAVLSITTPGLTGSYVVTLRGVGTQPQVTVSQTTLNFGSQQVGTTSATKVVTITNVSGQPFQINVVGATTPDYLISADQCSNRLLTTSGAGSTCTFEVSFRPTSGGTKNAEINIDGVNLVGAPLPATYVVRLEGIGFTSQVSADPVAINFPDQTVGTTSQPLRATLRNNTNGSLQVTSVSLPAGPGLFNGDYSLRNNFCQNGVNPTTLAPGGTCTVDIVFTPSDQGQRPAILRFATDAAGSAHDVPITGTGTFVVAVFEASAVDFGPQVINTTSVAQTIKVTNRGPGDLLIAQNGVTVTGPNAADFVITFNDGCAGALAPNASCSVQVKFTPSALGARQASLSFATNAAGNPNQVPLTGTGTPVPAYAVTINTVGNGCTTTVSPAGPYQGNALVTLTAQFNPATTVFIGWTLDGSYVGFANPLDFHVNNSSHNVLATCTPRPAFSDVNGGTPYNEAIVQLAARGVIKGLGDGSFGPGQGIVRAQMAAITVRLAGWSNLSRQNIFTDRCIPAGCVDDELWNAVAVTAAFQVARGYEDNTYRPFDPVANIQAVAFITRTMVKLGYWQFQPDDVTLYPNVQQGTGHRVDIATYVHYAGAVPGTANPTNAWPAWDQNATRAYLAGIYWQAYASYFGTDLVP